MRETLRSAVLAGLAVLALALAAATLDSTVVPERGTPGAPGPGEGGEGGLLPVPRSGPAPAETLDVPYLAELLAVLLVVAAVVAVVYALVHWRRTLAVAFAAVVLFAVSAILFQLLPPPPAPPGSPVLPAGNGSLFGGGGGGGTDGTTEPASPPTVVLVVLGLALLGALLAVFRTTSRDGEERSDEADDTTADAAAVGRAAGRAADRLERDTAVGNEVYRTWREMTDLLDVDDPGTSTPGEFAAAAVAAGLGREDVDELTRLFEDVRYGEARPSDEHERRAIAVFRRIEDRYAEADS